MKECNFVNLTGGQCNLPKEKLTSCFSSSLLLKTPLMTPKKRLSSSSIPKTSSYVRTKRSSFTPVETDKTVVLQAGEITIEWNLVITLRTNIFKHIKDQHNEGSSKKDYRKILIESHFCWWKTFTQSLFPKTFNFTYYDWNA